MKKVPVLGLLIAFACILSYIESLIPFFAGVPGMKLGLANAAVLTGLYLLGTKEAFFLSFVRIILMGILFGNIYSLLFSLAGGILSFLAMLFCKKTSWFSILGISIAGGVLHNVGQLLVAVLIFKTAGILYYLPILMICGGITGLAIGIAGNEVIKRMKPFFNTLK